MKRLFRYILVFILGFVLVSANVSISPKQVLANPGDYPRGTISFDGKIERDVNVSAGEKLAYTVNLTSAIKVCKVYVYSLGGPQHGKRQELNFTRGQSNGSVKGTFDTTGYPAGKYRLFMYATTTCAGDPFGNQDDGFDCDGNTTCLRYCGSSTAARTPVDNTLNGKPFEPGDLYRTNSNQAYICSGPNCQQNSCGEKKGSDPTDVTPGGTAADYRKGECELVACDGTGQNLDNLAFTIGSNSNSSPAASTSSSPNPSSSAGTNTCTQVCTTTDSKPGTKTCAGAKNQDGSCSAAATDCSVCVASGGAGTSNVSFPKTDVAGQVSATAANVSLNSNSSIVVTDGVSSATNNTIVVAGENKNLASFSRGNLTNVDLTVARNIGGVDVKVAKAVNIKSASGVTITNSSLQSVDLKIPADTTILSGSGWNGQIEPPKPVTASSGAPPAGFKIGDTIVSVGSISETLLFDRPVTVTFTGVANTSMGYRSPGKNDFVAIDKECQGGTYDNPTPPTFPKECFKVSPDGKNTKIVTYHLTEFATLNLVLPQIVSVDPGICWKDTTGAENIAVRLDFATNASYSQYQVAKKQCKSYTDCSGTVEQFEADGSIFNRGQPIITPPDDIRVKPGEFWQYRVWGALSSLGGAPNVSSPAQLDPRFWSLPVVVQVQCNAFGSGINIKQLIIPPKATSPARL